MMKIRPFLLLIFLALFWACEKRILLDTEFPHQDDLVFCEVVGFVGLGFFGEVTQVQKVEYSGETHKPLLLIIREEGSIIFEETLTTPTLSFPFFVRNDKHYSIEIEYENQIINSPEIQSQSPALAIENLLIDNQYIDSLQFDVATISFDFTAPIGSNPGGKNLFFAYTAELIPHFSQLIDLSNTSDTDSLSLHQTHFIEKRLANMTNLHIARVGLLSIDEPFYQYLKNIQQLGIIPNDDIEGHHGNLKGGIGYFGVVNYEVQLMEF